MSERDETEQLRHSWNANADAWTRAVREQKIASRRLATDAAIVEVTLSLRPRSVLDLGCGEGWLTRRLHVEGVAATGIDASPTLIEKAREVGDGIFEVASYEDLQSDAARAAGPYDAIVANFSLLHQDVRGLLRSLGRRLTSSGSLVVQTVHPAFAGGDYVDGWRVETFATMDGDWPEPMPWYFRTLASWVSELALGGFTVAEIREPLHPEERRPLSIVFVCRRSNI
jgi:2-polyprenyl-3-methyl-5-hydroxy-6-metoxy-1,4-benzoquinol methylase